MLKHSTIDVDGRLPAAYGPLVVSLTVPPSLFGRGTPRGRPFLRDGAPLPEAGWTTPPTGAPRPGPPTPPSARAPRARAARPRPAARRPGRGRRAGALAPPGAPPDGLAARGGLPWCEPVAILEDRPWRPMPARTAHERFRRLTTELCL